MNYLKNITKALEHNKAMKKFDKEIKVSIKETEIFSGFDRIEFVESKKYDTQIEIYDSTIENAVCMYHGENTAILNFASFKSPGGGYMKGFIAQEESLCHHSTLFQVLSNFSNNFYSKNKKDTNNGLYYNTGLFSPGIIFNEKYKVNVVTAAAPNMKEYEDYCNKEQIPFSICNRINIESLESRIDFLLGIMNEKNQTTIILGAFGCGIFMQSPIVVASIFHKLLETKYCGCFKRVIFAIPKNVNKNYEAFVYTFDESKKGLYKMDKKLNKYKITWFNRQEQKDQKIHIKAISKEDAINAAVLVMKSEGGVNYTEYDIKHIEEFVKEEYMTVEEIMKRYCKLNK